MCAQRNMQLADGCDVYVRFEQGGVPQSMCPHPRYEIDVARTTLSRNHDLKYARSRSCSCSKLMWAWGSVRGAHSSHSCCIQFTLCKIGLCLSPGQT